MWLFEGSQKALLVDTAQNTVDMPIVPGQLDLVTVVKQLLGHDNDGAVKPNPVDFEVAITHNHGDHTGKNAAMAPRTVYFPDGDWPANAPAHYVPIRRAAGDARGRSRSAASTSATATIEAVNQPGHTAGSTAYLDRENKMLATGDAYGSAYVSATVGTRRSPGYR